MAAMVAAVVAFELVDASNGHLMRAAGRPSFWSSRRRLDEALTAFCALLAFITTRRRRQRNKGWCSSVARSPKTTTLPTDTLHPKKYAAPTNERRISMRLRVLKVTHAAKIARLLTKTRTTIRQRSSWRLACY